MFDKYRDSAYNLNIHFGKSKDRKKKLSDFRQKMREDKKGFTLVELIVVLVILAILIALLVPTLTGYIDNANKKKVASEGRQILMAAIVP